MRLLRILYFTLKFSDFDTFKIFSNKNFKRIVINVNCCVRYKNSTFRAKKLVNRHRNISIKQRRHMINEISYQINDK